MKQRLAAKEEAIMNIFRETHDRTTYSTNPDPNYNYKLMNAKPAGK